MTLERIHFIDGPFAGRSETVHNAPFSITVRDPLSPSSTRIDPNPDPPATPTIVKTTEYYRIFYFSKDGIPNSFYSIEEDDQKQKQLIADALLQPHRVTIDLIGKENYQQIGFCHYAVEKKLPIKDFVAEILSRIKLYGAYF